MINNDNSFISYFNPFAKEYEKTRAHFSDLTKDKKWIVLATIVMTILTLPILGLGGLAIFRKLTERSWKSLNLKEENHQTPTLTKTNSLRPSVDKLIKVEKPKTKIPNTAVDYGNFLYRINWELLNKSQCYCAHFIDIDKAEEAQFFHLFENDREVHFPQGVIDVHKEWNTLIQTLQDAFAQGKTLAALKIGDHQHCECAAFDKDGNFIILAAWSGLHSTDLVKMTKALNETKIKDKTGKTIIFSGKYIDTGLQLGGHHCKRFAELYRYQIAKEKKFDAYKKVNGAFFNKQLKNFEDLEKIDRAIELDKIPRPNSNNNWEKSQYEFLLSWIARGSGVKQNKWEEITIKDIKITSAENKERSQIFGLPYENSIAPHHCRCWKGFKLENIKDNEKQNINENDTLENLFKNKKNILVFDKDGTFFLYTRKDNEELEMSTN